MLIVDAQIFAGRMARHRRRTASKREAPRWMKPASTAR
jgi:hypothetical protein